MKHDIQHTCAKSYAVVCTSAFLMTLGACTPMGGPLPPPPPAAGTGDDGGGDDGTVPTPPPTAGTGEVEGTKGATGPVPPPPPGGGTGIKGGGGDTGDGGGSPNVPEKDGDGEHDQKNDNG